MTIATRPIANTARRQRRPVFRSVRILRDATPEQLADAVQRNQAEWIHFEGQHLPGVELHADRDVTWVCSTVAGRPNAVAMARFNARDVGARIERIVRRYKQLDASTVWWVGPSSAPADLGKHLRGAGFHCFKHFPGMATDLRRLRAAGPAPARAPHHPNVENPHDATAAEQQRVPERLAANRRDERERAPRLDAAQDPFAVEEVAPAVGRHRSEEGVLVLFEDGEVADLRELQLRGCAPVGVHPAQVQRHAGEVLEAVKPGAAQVLAQFRRRRVRTGPPHR